MAEEALQNLEKGLNSLERTKERDERMKGDVTQLKSESTHDTFISGDSVYLNHPSMRCSLGSEIVMMLPSPCQTYTVHKNTCKPTESYNPHVNTLGCALWWWKPALSSGTFYVGVTALHWRDGALHVLSLVVFSPGEMIQAHFAVISQNNEMCVCLYICLWCSIV